MPQTAIVTGASGLVGNELVLALLQDEAFSSVKVMVRKPLTIQHPKLINLVLSFEDENALHTALTGDVLFCCTGTTIRNAGSRAAFKAVDYDIPVQCGAIALKNGVRKYLLVSASGANEKSSNFYLRTKGETEQALIRMQYPSLCIFRPSLLMGRRKEFRFGEQVAQFLMPVFSFLLRGNWKKYRPVKAEVLAKEMVRKAKEDVPGVRVIEGFD